MSYFVSKPYSSDSTGVEAKTEAKFLTYWPLKNCGEGWQHSKKMFRLQVPRLPGTGPCCIHIQTPCSWLNQLYNTSAPLP